MRLRAAWLTCLAGLLLLACKGGFPPFVHLRSFDTITLTGSPTEIVALASDPEGSKTSIRFDWGDGEVSDWSGPTEPGEEAAMSHTWTEPDDYTVLAQARDVQGRTSDWVAWTEVRVLDSALVKWFKRIWGIAPDCPAVGPDGSVYVPAAGQIHAFGPDGNILWSTDRLYLSGAPVVGPDGSLYARRQYYGPDLLYALNPDGSVKWVDSLDCDVPPAVGSDGTVYLVADSSLYALNPDGTRRWVLSDTNNAEPVSPVIGPDGTIYFTCYPGILHAARPDGTLKWTLDLEGRIRGAMAVGPDGTVYLTSDWDLCAVGSDGTLKWTYVREYYGVSRPLVGPDGTVYCLSVGVHALSPDSGTRLWYTYIDEDSPAMPAINADTMLYLGSGQGLIHVLNPDGSLQAHVPTVEDAEHSPAAIGPDGTVYVAVKDMYLFALKGSAPLASGCWPKAHCDAGNTGCAAR
ncbi:MAG: PQQ-like beta-propeller repeat protein [candidate division WOR-3 bacterium]|nr:MAG: PQQ-like beta-propeller repeat protein [candidate division WOR-3 bacterium]